MKMHHMVTKMLLLLATGHLSGITVWVHETHTN